MPLPEFPKPVFLAAVGALGFLACTVQRPSPTPSVSPPLPSPPQAAARPTRPTIPSELPRENTDDALEGVARVQAVLRSLSEYDRQGRSAAEHFVSFELWEADVNHYLAYTLRDTPRPGFTSAIVRFLPDNQIEARLRLTVDFEAIGRSIDAAPAPLSPRLAASPEIQIQLSFESGSGSFRFAVKDARGPEGIVIPNALMSEAIRFIAERQPEGYDISRPMPLPFGVDRIWTNAQKLAGETPRE